MKHRFNINMIFYYISFLLLLVATVSIISLFQLGGAIDIIIKENLPSAIAAEKMSESLTQMHMLILDNQGSITVEFNSDLESSVHDFTQSLIKAKHNITISGEEEIVREIEDYFRRYRETVGSLKNQGFNRNIKYALSDLYRKNIELIKQLISINDQAIMIADENAKSLAKSRSIWMIFLALIGFMSVFYLTRTIRNNFSEPIDDMLLSLRRANFGDQNIRLSKQAGHLGELSEYINSLLDAKKSNQSNAINYVFEQRDLVSALVEMKTEPVFILNVGYRIILSNEKARNILQSGEHKNLERRLFELVQKKESSTFDINDAAYDAHVLVLRDRGLNKIGYAITFTESIP